MASDQLLRFVFDGTDVRGEIITLEQSYQGVLATGNYPAAIAALLGETLAAAGLLSATMKFDGILTLQARGDGALSLLMADCTRQHQLRGIARLRPDTHWAELAAGPGDLRQLLGQAHLAITIDPANGERYQGIVPLESATLAGCIEAYFRQSEQLPTRLWLFADGTRAGGLLLQGLPLQQQSQEQRDLYWQHLAVLGDTLTSEEFLAADSQTILTRLFHQEQVRLFDPTAMAFACSCSRDRTAAMLASLGEAEVRQLLAEQGLVDVQCQFCDQQYRFDGVEVDAIFNPEIKTLH